MLVAGSRPTVAAPSYAAACARGPPPRACGRWGAPAPPAPPRSRWSRPATVAGASGERCPATRGFFIGYRLAAFMGAGGSRPRVCMVARVLHFSRGVRVAGLPLVALQRARPSFRFARTASMHPLRSPVGRPRPHFTLQGVRAVRPISSSVSQIDGHFGAVALMLHNDLGTLLMMKSDECRQAHPLHLHCGATRPKPARHPRTIKKRHLCLSWYYFFSLYGGRGWGSLPPAAHFNPIIRAQISQIMCSDTHFLHLYVHSFRSRPKIHIKTNIHIIIALYFHNAR